MLKQDIVIASNFTSEPIRESLQFLLEELQIRNEISFAPFNQIFQELLAPSSLFRANARGVNIVLFRFEDLVETEGFTSGVLRQIEENVEGLTKALKQASDLRVPLLAAICPPSKTVRENTSASRAIETIQTSFIRELAGASHLTLILLEDFLGELGVDEYDDARSNNYGRIPYTMEAFAAAGYVLARKIHSLSTEPFKVIVLDCDQTLWKGVVGEDGVGGIEFSAPYLALQEFMAAQSAAGMLICLCSKNNEPDVWQVFDSRPEMKLRREHIVASQINWNYKSENLKQLARDLELSLNSFIFVDDDAAVCAEVRANCPEVLTLMLPKDIDEMPAFLRRVWAFDRIKTTDEDKARTRSYQQQVDRNRLQSSAASFEEFLAGLELECEISELVEDQVPRVSQLSLRTNQFNTTTKRRSEIDVRNFRRAKRRRIWTVSVRDRFGDYGLVGAMFGDEVSRRLRIDSMMLSCRALGRGIEHRMLAEIGRAASESKCEFVELEFVASEKNAPAANFLDQVGNEFKAVDGDVTIYRFPAHAAAAVRLDAARTTTLNNAGRIELKAVAVREDGPTRNSAITKIAGEFRTARDILSAVRQRPGSRPNIRSAFVPPRTAAERKLADIWQRTLGISRIGVTDDFFELGGDSLMAVSLFVEIEDAFGTHLPLTELIESPTIAKMSKALEHHDSQRSIKYLVPLKTGGERTPLFCMHAAGGNVLFYRDLATELGDDLPVYGLQARGVADRSETAHENVSEMAADYLAEMRTIQPAGPYRICGSSFGGLIAFEMACQLHSVGEKVSLLALFDTYAPGYPNAKPESFPLERRLRGSLARLKRLREQIVLTETPREKLEFIGKQVKKLRMRAKRKKAWKRNQFDIEYAMSTGRELPLNVRRNHLAIQKALETFQPTAFEGSMVLFRAAIQPAGVIFEPTLGWRRFTRGEITVREVPGSHGAVTVHPFAKHLARELSPFLVEQNLETPAAQSAAA